MQLRNEALLLLRVVDLEVEPLVELLRRPEHLGSWSIGWVDGLFVWCGCGCFVCFGAGAGRGQGRRGYVTVMYVLYLPTYLGEEEIEKGPQLVKAVFLVCWGGRGVGMSI